MIPERKIETEKARIMAHCAKCGGAGCAICRKYCSFIEDMATACIPVDYWFRDMEKWHGDQAFIEWFKESHLSKLSKIYADGKVLCLVGHRGVGKTMAACGLLKKAILSGYSAHYTSLVDAVDNLVSEDAHAYRQILKTSDFLVIDEVDQRFFGSVNSRALFGSQFEHILRTRTQNKLPMIMCSNSEEVEEIFADQFQESFRSLGTQFLNIRRIEGKDARKDVK